MGLFLCFLLVTKLNKFPPLSHVSVTMMLYMGQLKMELSVALVLSAQLTHGLKRMYWACEMLQPVKVLAEVPHGGRRELTP